MRRKVCGYCNQKTNFPNGVCEHCGTPYLQVPEKQKPVETDQKGSNAQKHKKKISWVYLIFIIMLSMSPPFLMWMYFKFFVFDNFKIFP